MLISWVSKYDGRGTAAARKDFARLGKTALSTKLTVGAMAYAFQRLATSAVSAAAAEQQSLNVLNRTLTNAGFANATTQVSDFISGLQRTTSILDNELRPAFITLFNSIGDVGASEQMLAKATDYAAGTGKSLETVVTALSRAFAGNRESLNELNTGLDKSFIKTASLRDIMTELDRKFAGEAKASLAGFAGQILSVQAAITTASEAFGKGFIDQLNLGQVDIVKFTDGIYNIGRAVGWLTDKAIGAINAIAGLKQWFIDFAHNTLGWSKWLRPNVIDPIGTLHDSISSLTQTSSNPLEAYFRRIEMMQAKAAAAAAAKARAEKAQKLRQALLDKKTAETQMQYDVERIGLMKALSAARDADTQKRLTDLLKINTATYAEALGLDSVESILKLINDQMEKWYGKQSAIKMVTDSTASAYDALLSKMNATAAASGLGRDFYYGTGGSTAVAQAIGNISEAQAAAALTNMFPEADRASKGSGNFGSYGNTAPTVVNVNVSGSLVAQADLEAALAGAVNSSARAGLSYAQVFSRL